MPSTTTTARQLRTRSVCLALLAALLLLALALAAPAWAATEYTGGPVAGDYPLYIANDHSVYALRFEASAGLRDKDGALLTATGSYYVKIRISPTPAPGGGNSRGFTWNPVSGEWVQERDEWDKFPVVTTTASGTITKDESGWIYFKFGDTTKPTTVQPNPWYIIVSLLPTDATVDGRTNNSVSATNPAVSVIDMSGSLSGVTGAFRIHNGVATGVAANKRAEAYVSGSLAEVWSVSRTEDNGVDDGNTTATGDFGLAVPLGMAFDARLEKTVWPPAAAGFVGMVAGADVALGAADTTPPPAPTGFAATIEGTTAHLSWDAVADATGYKVYQWQDATPIDGATNYTPLHELVATVAGTSHDVIGLASGETYHFEVRAVDAATNMSPPTTYPAALSLATSASVVKWRGTATLTGQLTDGAEPFRPTQEVRAESSVDGVTWVVVDTLSPGTSFWYSIDVRPAQKTRYRLLFFGDGVHAAATSPTVTVTPLVKLGRPVAPATVKKGRVFKPYGSLAPKHPAGSKMVKIKCYKKQAGKWRLKKTVTAKNARYRTVTRYSARLALPSRGSWKLVAVYAATAEYAKTTSGAEYLKVK